MKKTTATIFITMLALSLTASVFGQNGKNKRAKGETTLGDIVVSKSNHSQGNARRKPRNTQISPQPIPSYKEGGVNDTTHKTQTPRMNRRAGNIKFDGIDGEIRSNKPNAAKYDGIDGESNDARTKNRRPNARRR